MTKEQDAMERALSELVDKICPGLDTGDLLADAATASRFIDTTLPAALSAQRQPLTGDSTTFVQRFTDAVAIICGAEPPAEFVDEWLRNVEVDFVARLQEWVLSQDGAPQWAQGIVMLDAAYLLADSPQEGMRHEAAHSIGAKHD